MARLLALIIKGAIQLQKTLAVCTMAAVLCLMAIGCGNETKLQTKGRLLKAGQPLIPKDDESIRVTFVPILPDGKPPRDHYFAEFDPVDATFTSAGKDLQGMPPGKYRVAVEYKKNKRDVLAGKFDENRSPFVFDVDAGTKELVVDLDKVPAK
jgi:hypothetical protein